jgi:hypothetical protein
MGTYKPLIWAIVHFEVDMEEIDSLEGFAT